MSFVREIFVPRLLGHFVIRQPDEDAFINDLDDALSTFSSDALQKGAKHLIHSAKSTSFPPIGVCADACRQFQPSTEADRPENKRFGVKDDKSDPTRWNKLLEGPLGIEAGEQGWIIYLLDFVNMYERLPNDVECGRLYQAAEGTLRTLSDPTNPFAAILLGGWNRRTEKLTHKARRATA